MNNLKYIGVLLGVVLMFVFLYETVFNETKSSNPIVDKAFATIEKAIVDKTKNELDKTKTFKYHEELSLHDLVNNLKYVYANQEDFLDKEYKDELKIHNIKLTDIREEGVLIFKSMSDEKAKTIFVKNSTLIHGVLRFEDSLIVSIVSANEEKLRSSSFSGQENYPTFSTTDVYVRSNGIYLPLNKVFNKLLNIEKTVDYLSGEMLTYNAQTFQHPAWGLNYNCIKIEPNIIERFKSIELLSKLNSLPNKSCKKADEYPSGKNIVNLVDPKYKGTGFLFSALEYVR